VYPLHCVGLFLLFSTPLVFLSVSFHGCLAQPCPTLSFFIDEVCPPRHFSLFPPSSLLPLKPCPLFSLWYVRVRFVFLLRYGNDLLLSSGMVCQLPLDLLPLKLETASFLLLMIVSWLLLSAVSLVGGTQSPPFPDWTPVFCAVLILFFASPALSTTVETSLSLVRRQTPHFFFVRRAF